MGRRHVGVPHSLPRRYERLRAVVEAVSSRRWHSSLATARGPEDYRAIADRLGSFPPVPTTDADHRRALEIQATLAARSHHRALSLVAGLVAAAADARDLVVLHYDADFELVAEITGQAQEWVVPRGTAD